MRKHWNTVCSTDIVIFFTSYMSKSCIFHLPDILRTDSNMQTAVETFSIKINGEVSTPKKNIIWADRVTVQYLSFLLRTWKTWVELWQVPLILYDQVGTWSFDLFHASVRHAIRVLEGERAGTYYKNCQRPPCYASVIQYRSCWPCNQGNILSEYCNSPIHLFSAYSDFLKQLYLFSFIPC